MTGLLCIFFTTVRWSVYSDLAEAHDPQAL